MSQNPVPRSCADQNECQGLLGCHAVMARAHHWMRTLVAHETCPSWFCAKRFGRKLAGISPGGSY